MEPFNELNHMTFFKTCHLATFSFLNDKMNKWSIPVTVSKTSDENFLMDLFYRNESIEGYYNKMPRVQINFGSVEILTSQFSNKNTRGNFKIDTENETKSYSGKLIRIPISVPVTFTLYSENYAQHLQHIEILIRTFFYETHFQWEYLQQTVQSKIQFTTSIGETSNSIELEFNSEKKYYEMELSLEVQTNFPLFVDNTILPKDNVMNTFSISQTDDKSPKTDLLNKTDI